MKKLDLLNEYEGLSNMLLTLWNKRHSRSFKELASRQEKSQLTKEINEIKRKMEAISSHYRLFWNPQDLFEVNRFTEYFRGDC